MCARTRASVRTHGTCLPFGASLKHYQELMLHFHEMGPSLVRHFAGPSDQIAMRGDAARDFGSVGVFV
jgi:hypothetical protein